MDKVEISSNEEYTDYLIKEEGKNYLKKCEIPIYWLGYKYILTGCIFVTKKLFLEEKIKLKDMYLYIAKKHKTTSPKVYGAIRYVYENTDIAKKLEIEDISTMPMMISISSKILEKIF